MRQGSFEELIRLVYYNESSPTGLRWKVQIRTGADGRVPLREVGDVAGGLDKTRDRYRLSYDDFMFMVHNIVWVLHHGPIPEGMVVDHKDGDALNNSIDNLRLVSVEINNRNRAKLRSNKTGVTGVHTHTVKCSSGSYEYYVAHWTPVGGKPKSKFFSVLKHGNDEAFRLACEYRARMIEELNNQGAGYTERHGT